MYDRDGLSRTPFPIIAADRSNKKGNVEFYFNRYLQRIGQGLRDFAIAEVWRNYSGKVRTFVHQVGCAKVHQRPEENIAELRLFHATTIGHFAKLQSEYLKKEVEMKKLRHHISALELRHLLEHLPDIALHNKAGPRWKIFWEDALNDEAGHFVNGRLRTAVINRTTQPVQHALKEIVEKRNPKYIRT